jgi:hypothetical protein
MGLTILFLERVMIPPPLGGGGGIGDVVMWASSLDIEGGGDWLTCAVSLDVGEEGEGGGVGWTGLLEVCEGGDCGGVVWVRSLVIGDEGADG